MLTVYKEKGYTSSDAVARLRGILRMRKIGHTGTLDPDAEGVLPMCLGRATRICELIADREKEYRAVMRLGVRTDTQDMSGTVLEEISDREVAERLGPPEEAAQRIREAAGRLTGQIDRIAVLFAAGKEDADAT
jgi:tRNA pseudouridine55 synthase